MALLTGACGAPLAVSAVSYGSDGAMLAASDKTGTDHLASLVSKKDCALWRVLRGREICKEREEGAKDPYAVDYTEPQRSVSEDGTTYLPPLRPAPDSPASSWDAATYKVNPVPLPAPSEPVTAVAEATPAQPAATTPVAPKAKKALVARSAKKPSRGRVAPAP